MLFDGNNKHILSWVESWVELLHRVPSIIVDYLHFLQNYDVAYHCNQQFSQTQYKIWSIH